MKRGIVWIALTLAVCAPQITLAQDSLEACAEKARTWATTNLNGSEPSGERAKTSSDVVIAFTQKGAMCWRSSLRITQGDYIYVGVYGNPDVVNQFRLNIPTCSLESTAINIIEPGEQGAGSRPDSVQQAILGTFPAVECFDDSITIEIRGADNSVAFSQSLQQYGRFRGTFQFGTLWTQLDDPTYSVSNTGSGPTIRSNIDDSRGPQYVGSVVVYGLPHYFRSLGRGSARYSGRDIVNENSFSDRLGLALSFGLDNPKDTLGIGFSFELITGINLTVTQLYRRVSVLEGLALGDPFSGAAGDIPTQKSWEDEVTFGLSIDGRYLGKFFGSGGPN